MNDVFLVLAQAPEGLSCFVVPRALPDGSRNRLDVVRLKDKLGNRSNASSEIELDGTLARRLGDEGRGVRTIIEMVAATRLDCVLGSASLMRHALAEASWHVAHRSAFGSLLADKPLMQNVVADLAVESEAATALAIRLAAAVDRIDDPHEAALRRIALPLAKPGLATVTIFSFLAAWDEFTWAITTLSDSDLYTLPIGIRLLQRSQSTEWGLVFAASLIALAPVLVIFVALQRHFVAGAFVGATKG